MKLHPSVVEKFVYLCRNYGGHQHEDKLRVHFEQANLSIHINPDGSMFLVETQLLLNERNSRRMDVLVIAADDAKKVLALVEAVDPRVVLLFQVKGGDLGGVAKACGQASVAPVAEFKVKPGSLPQDARQVVVLGE
jgi:hypothetical protein